MNIVGARTRRRGRRIMCRQIKIETELECELQMSLTLSMIDFRDYDVVYVMHNAAMYNERTKEGPVKTTTAGIYFVYWGARTFQMRAFH